ncbi:MAG: hypothetical protein IAG13_22325 [Deltaproteobacteria bacterium]|nr:hypothetical protein [Nannocystaceae bacterium]
MLAFAGSLSVGCYSGASDRAAAEDPQEDDGGSSSSSSDGAGLAGNGECTDVENYFREQVWAPLLKEKCFACHNPAGQAKTSDLVLQGPEYPGYLDVNLQTVQNIAKLEIEGTSLVLLKPSAQIEHGGGAQIEKHGDEYAALEELLARIDQPVHCRDDADLKAFYADLTTLDEVHTLRKATFLLAGRLPTDEEIAQVDGEGIDALDPVLDAVMHEEAFYARLVEIYNDMMHTDAYLIGDDAVDTIDGTRFPMKRWYDAIEDDDARVAARDATNDAIAREPLQLIDWVVRHELPFSEILTANYTLVNPWSARSYGLSMDLFVDPADPQEWVPTTFAEFPHAGLLTTSVFLNRYPTTPTNRNRARSRVLYKFFLATDVLRLAVRPIDAISTDDFNPTLYDPNCTVCHDNVDPIAGIFQGWDEVGRYLPPAEGWFADMRPPGFGDVQVPFEEGPRALQWLMPTLVGDRKFALSVVHAMYTGLTGQEPLAEPYDAEASDYLQRIRAYEAQDAAFGDIATAFVDSGLELRVVVRELVKTPWFRAIDSDVPLSDSRRAELLDMGTAHLLSPEQLHRRIIATTGVPWKQGGSSPLLSANFFKYFYGGIDSASVTVRLTEMNGVMANVADRMANEVACLATPLDFSRAPADRLLVPLVEPGDLPGTPAGDAAIRANVVHLHEQLLGESPGDDDAEIDRTVALFEAVLELGRAGLVDETSPLSTTLPEMCQPTVDPITAMPVAAPLTEDPSYTVRAWMAVVTYLLGDAEYLYE